MVAQRSPARMLHRHVLTALVCLTVALSSVVSAQESEGVMVNDPRPLAAAVREFANRCQCVVTYEDVKWAPDQVEPSQLGRRRSDGKPELVPRGRPFTFTVPRDLSLKSPAEILESLRAVLDQFSMSQNPGRFRVVRGQTALHVLPEGAAILEKRVSVTVDNTPALSALEAVLERLGRASGEKVTPWTVPVNTLVRPIRATASDEPAYDVISKVLSAADKRLYWTLSYEVNEKFYFMTVYAIKPLSSVR